MIYCMEERATISLVTKVEMISYLVVQEMISFFGGPGKDYFNCGLGNDEIMDFDQIEGDGISYSCER